MLPFAGAEMLLLGWALHSNMQRRFERETIDITGNAKWSSDYSRGKPRRVVFPRHWARVKIRRPKSPLHRGHLVIESHGRAYEVGQVSDRGGASPAGGRIAALIGGMNQSPALPRDGSPDQFS